VGALSALIYIFVSILKEVRRTNKWHVWASQCSLRHYEYLGTCREFVKRNVELQMAVSYRRNVPDRTKYHKCEWISPILLSESKHVSIRKPIRLCCNDQKPYYAAEMLLFMKISIAIFFSTDLFFITKRIQSAWLVLRKRIQLIQNPFRTKTSTCGRKRTQRRPVSSPYALVWYASYILLRCYLKEF
jgi:hypothetical protein